MAHEQGQGGAQDTKVAALRAGYEAIQKKTFTKWANNFIKDRGFEIKDLATDLQDGKALTALLERLSGETLVGSNCTRSRWHGC